MGRMHAVTALGLLATMGLAGCSSGSGDGSVVEFRIHIGWNPDGKTQYMTSDGEMRVQRGDHVRFIITNDDDPERDYNGATNGMDNFHDVALRNYDYDGNGDLDTLEHEVIAGTTVSTCLVDNNPCPEGKDFFVASTKGTFRLICEVGDPGGGKPTRHEGLGMWAPFIVE